MYLNNVTMYTIHLSDMPTYTSHMPMSLSHMCVVQGEITALRGDVAHLFLALKAAESKHQQELAGVIIDAALHQTKVSLPFSKLSPQDSTAIISSPPFPFPPFPCFRSLLLFSPVRFFNRFRLMSPVACCRLLMCLHTFCAGYHQGSIPPSCLLSAVKYVCMCKQHCRTACALLALPWSMSSPGARPAHVQA